MAKRKRVQARIHRERDEQRIKWFYITMHHINVCYKYTITFHWHLLTFILDQWCTSDACQERWIIEGCVLARDEGTAPLVKPINARNIWARGGDGV